jgi:hypothetical protein
MYKFPPDKGACNESDRSRWRIYRPSIHAMVARALAGPPCSVPPLAAAPAAVVSLALAGRPAASPSVPIGMDGRIIYTCIRSYYEARMHCAHNAIQPPLRHHRPAGPAGRRCPSEIERDRIGYTHHARTIDFLSSCRATLLTCRSMQSIRHRGTR